MRIYIVYFLSTIFTIWLLYNQLAYEQRFTSYILIVALFGILLLMVATPILVIKKRLGLYLGLLGCLLLLPYVLVLLIEIISELIQGTLKPFLLLIVFIPPILVLLATYLTIKTLVKKDKRTEYFRNNKPFLITLILIPIVLFCIYFIFHGNFWIEYIIFGF